MSEEALKLGLINRLYEPKDLLNEAIAYARSMIENVSPESLKITKRQIYTDLHRDLASSVHESEELLKAMMKQANYKAGVKALNNKEKPVWENDSQ